MPFDVRLGGGIAFAAALVLLTSGCGRYGYDTPDGEMGGPSPEPADVPACQDALACPDFDEGSESAWVAAGTNGQISYVESPDGVGTVVMADQVSPRSEAYLSFVAAPHGELYVRADFYIESAVDIDSLLLLGIRGEDHDRYFRLSDTDGAGLEVDGDEYFEAFGVPRDAWFCAQLQVTSNTTRLVVGDTLAAEAFSNPGSFSEVVAGIVDDPGSPDHARLYFDNIIVSPSPLACD